MRKVGDLIKVETRGRVWGQLNDQDREYVYDQIRTHLGVQVNEHIKEQIWDER